MGSTTRYPLTRLTGTLCLGLGLLLGLTGCPPESRDDQLNDIAQSWMRLALEGTRAKGQGPTVEARKLWYVSSAMYEAWAVYDDTATGYFTGRRLKAEAGEPTLENRAETLSHAVYPVLRDGFKVLAGDAPGTPGHAAYSAFRAHMQEFGYLDELGRPVTSPAQALGAKIADEILEFCKWDGANEAGHYEDTSGYAPVNPPLEMDYPMPELMDVNYWQPIRVPSGNVQPFMTPQWCFVKPFALPDYDGSGLRIDPGEPPLYGTESEQEFIDNFMEVLVYSASLDPAVGLGGETVNISPGARGNNTYPNDDGTGRPVNPFTGEAYADNFVKRGDYYRAQAAFLDGNRFNMPGPWWFEIATDVLAGTGLVHEQPTNKPARHDLEYDVKLYFALGGAMHDTAIAVWDVKRHYDWVRPITAIRWLGQNNLLPLRNGVVEVIGENDVLAGPDGENVGRQKIKAWRGPFTGVGWMLPEHWMPYQHPGFVTPPFPGYTSGHAAFGWSFKEVMVAYTEDLFVPGGLMEWKVTELPFDAAPSEPVYLQWATYQDVADDGGIGRLMCGVHPTADSVASRPIGRQCGREAMAVAREYFAGLKDGVVSGK
jgi:hypothetical protein